MITYHKIRLHANLFIAFVLVIAECLWSSPLIASDYKPNFRWVAGGVSGEGIEYDFTLYDRDEPIGYFFKENLSFYEYKLVPGVTCGNPRNQTYGISLYAQNQYWGAEALNIKDFRVDLSDPTRFIMTANVGQKYISEEEDSLDIDANLEVAWDADLNCYSWTVTKKMKVLGGDVLDEPYIEFEDTYFKGHYYHDQRYEHYIWKAQDGNYYKMPFNNDKSMDKYDWIYAPNGFWVACCNNESNPALEWLLGGSKNLKTSICWLSLDLHSYWLPRNERFHIGETKTVQYRFVSYPYEKAKSISQQSKFRDLPDDPMKDFPMRDWPLTKFDKNVYRTTKLGVYSWEAAANWDPIFPEDYDPNCIWDKTQGYDDNFSLKIDAHDGQMHRWGLTAVDYNPTMEVKGESSFSFMVKTQDLQGYAKLVYCNIYPEYSCISSDFINGRNDWSKMTLKVPNDFFRGGNSYLYFEVQGPGVVWFDNLQRESEAGLSAYVSQDRFCAGNNPCFPNIQNGIALTSIPSIKITQETYNEDIVLDFDQVIILQGGWDTNFTSNPSSTTIQGSITITHGTMIIESIIVE